MRQLRASKALRRLPGSGRLFRLIGMSAIESLGTLARDLFVADVHARHAFALREHSPPRVVADEKVFG